MNMKMNIKMDLENMELATEFDANYDRNSKVVHLWIIKCNYRLNRDYTPLKVAEFNDIADALSCIQNIMTIDYKEYILVRNYNVDIVDGRVSNRKQFGFSKVFIDKVIKGEVSK